MKIKIPKQRINCKCGKEITPNTFSNHLKSRRCSLSNEEKIPLFDLIQFSRKHPRGWLKKEGENALGTHDWFVSVYNKETAIDDWVFESPREPNVVTSKTREKYKTDRIGLGNPAVKKAPKYDTEELKTFAKTQIQLIGTQYNSIPAAVAAIEAKYPKFQYMMTEVFEYRAHNSSIVAWALDMPLEKAKEWAIKKRGVQISKGQKSSPAFLEMASRMAANMCKWRVTQPHLELFNRWQKEDPDAEMEFKVKHFFRTYSYDIYSPKYNLLIEMHGHFWHRPAPDTLKSVKVLGMISRNLKNDVQKEKIALDQGYNFLVFWDDQKDKWESQIEEFLNNVKKDCQGAQPGDQAGIRSGSPQQP